LKILDKEFTIRTKCVVNATGPYTDEIRQLDDPSMAKICQPSVGVHIVLPDYYSPTNMGLLDPNTSDGRVIFFLPWQNHTMAGLKLKISLKIFFYLKYLIRYNRYTW
jgi:glycerol-3-phosphate dehydrogenase